ncbi:hypothetical protein Halru_1788 [Halovivax ruber XH-70]|uniref:Uncharacterized protein n=1 Tax=Halovivax ruber (strain DSM 18193 / JCM 13892 / XH-70) TaxID=797302 RepID=L0IEK9_HALRX|nr:hypothetical protein [Halovivax ruber]AGB16387.1 hypothetical protein Halru_1788 [Halovivax ruber XH-70]
MIVDDRSSTLEVRVTGSVFELSESTARALYRALDDALPNEHEFCKTIGIHRDDGRYVVERRGATSSGHRKVFDSFDALGDRYASLPKTITASDLDGPGLSGSRRHAVLWHLIEHPAFDCELDRKQPLTAVKRDV